MCDFETLKHHNQSTRSIVSYFIGKSQRLFSDEECPYYNIPGIVVAVTTLYYVHAEYFTSHGTKLQLNNRMNRIESHGSYTRYSMCYNTVYGNINLNVNDINNFYKWTFKVIRELYPRGLFGIGIDSSHRQFVETCYYDTKWNPNHFYSLQFDECLTYTFSQKQQHLKYAPCEYKHITTISMELNIKQKTLKYYFDGGDKGVAFHDIHFNNKTAYFLALMLDNNTAIQFTDFYQTKLTNEK